MPSELLPETVPPRVPDHELLRRVGSGAYGDVWLARNVMGSWRAVKIVYRDRFTDERPYEREFAGIRQFEPVSRSHESQVDILHVGRDDAERWFYYVMELADDSVSGREIDPGTYTPRTLQRELSACGRLTVERCLAIGASLATALEHLQKHGLAHRDIKPANIVFINGQPKLADPGLITRTDSAMSFVGTAGFIPPEGPGTAAADIFSLGKVLYEAHTGLGGAEFPALPTELTANEDTALAQELNLVILRACAADARRRHASATELREELQLLQSGRSVGRLRRAEKRAEVFRRIGVIASGVALLALVATAAAWRSQRAAEEARQQTLREKVETDAQRHRAEEALWQARLQQARAGRLSRQIGQRATGLAAIREAAKRRTTPELVSEAIAHLAMMDCEVTPVWWNFPARTGNAAFDPGVALIALGDATGEGRVQRLTDGSEIFRWSNSKLQGGPPQPLALSADGQALLAGRGGTWLFADLRTGEIQERNHGKDRFCQFSPDGRHYLVVRPAPDLAIHETASGEKVAEVPAGKVGEWSQVACFAPDGSMVAAVRSEARNDSAQLWRWQTRELVRTWPRTGRITALAISARQLAIGQEGGALTIVSLDADITLPLPNHRGHVDRLWFSPDGRLLMSHAYDGASRFYDTGTAQLLFETSRMTPLAMNPEMTRLACRTFSGAGIWEMQRADSYRTLACHGPGQYHDWHPDLNSDASLLLARNREGIQFFDAASHASLGFHPIPGELQTARFLPDGRTLFTSDRRQLSFRSFERTGNEVRLGEPRHVIPPNTRWLERAQLSDDRRHAVLAVDHNAALLVDLAEPSGARRFGGLQIPAHGVISPDRRFIAMGTFHGVGPVVLETGTGRVTRLEQDNANLFLNPAGDRLLAAGPAMYRVYDTATWQKVHEIVNADGTTLPNFACWSPDGRVLAIRRERKAVELLDGRTFQSIARLDSPAAVEVASMMFSQKNDRLVVGTTGARVDVWNLRALGEELAALGIRWELPRD